MAFSVKGELAGSMEQAGDHGASGSKSIDVSASLTATLGFSPFAFFFSVKGKMEVTCLECQSFSRLIKYSIRSLLKVKVQERAADKNTAEFVMRRLEDFRTQDAAVTYKASSSADDRQSQWSLALANRLNVLVTSFAIKLHSLAKTYHSQVADLLRKAEAIGLTQNGLSEDVYKSLAPGNHASDADSNLTKDERNVDAWLKAVESTFGIFRDARHRGSDSGTIRHMVPIAVRRISQKIKAPAVTLAKEIKAAALHTFFDASREWPHFINYAVGQYCSPAMAGLNFSAIQETECQAYCKNTPGCAAFSYNSHMRECFLCSGLTLSNETKERIPLESMHKWASYRKQGFSCFGSLKSRNVVELEPCPGSSAEKPNWRCYPKFHDGKAVGGPSAGISVHGAKIKVEFPAEFLCELLQGHRTEPDEGEINVDELSVKEWITAPDCKDFCKDDESSCSCSADDTSRHDSCRCDCIRLNDKMPRDYQDTMPYELLVMFPKLFSTLDVGFLTPSDPDAVGEQLARDSSAHLHNQSLEGESPAVFQALVKTLGPQIQKAKKLEERLSELQDEAKIREFRSEVQSMFATTFPCPELMQSSARLQKGAVQRCCISGIQGWLLDFCTEKEMQAAFQQSVVQQIERSNTTEDIFWTFSGTVAPIGISTPFSKTTVENSKLTVEKDRIEEERVKMQGHANFAELTEYNVTNLGTRKLSAASTKTTIGLLGMSITHMYRNCMSVGVTQHKYEPINLPPQISRMFGIDSQKHFFSVKFPLPGLFSFADGSSVAALFAEGFLNTLLFAMADGLLQLLSSLGPDSGEKTLKKQLQHLFATNGATWSEMVHKWFKHLKDHFGRLKIFSGLAVAALGAATGTYTQTLELSIAFRSSCLGCEPTKPWAISFFAAVDTSAGVDTSQVLGGLVGAGTGFSGGIKLSQKYTADLSGLFLLYNCSFDVDTQAEQLRNYVFGTEKQSKLESPKQV
eukprot:TRINITY_DN16571_c0_g1_i1.p1 TRINITY_DN16571_c0_g1~~TRINITY_DN16571_c0_g1_i1.p1  ORF type:complete len:1105 (-),score=161.11 TRINITY_DN16571_c0_g1_i1:214-3123(-)